MVRNVLIPLYKDETAPRFDLCAEVLIAGYDNGRRISENIIVLQQPSAEDLCHMILKEKIDLVICGGIEEEYYQYLNWKDVKVIDDVIGEKDSVLDRYEKGGLKRGDILFAQPTEKLEKE
ncbi:MAG: hypothetical protein K9J83_05215 [Desulfarculaceae bacterium]|nr:hypothetical protein [Desulfarculaceae bacterium]